MKKLFTTTFALLISIYSIQAQDSTASVKECISELKTGFRVHGVTYEFGQEDLNFLDKNIFNNPFYEFHEFGIELQLGATKRQQKLLSIDIGLVDNDGYGAGYYAKLDYSLKLRFLKMLYITPQVGLGSGQFFFHNEITDPDYYENYNYEDEYPRLFIHTGIAFGVDLEPLTGLPFEVFASRQRFNEFWTPYSNSEIFNNKSSSVGMTYTF